VVPPLLALGLGHRYTAVGGVAGALVE
jgi:hypothetical protein